MSGALDSITGGDGGGLLGAAFGDIGQDLGFPSLSELTGGLTGQTAADASLAAAQLQRQSAIDALEYTKEKDALARADLQPFVGNSANLLKLYQGMLNPQAQANYLTSNPMFQAAMEKSNTGLRNTLGYGGKRGDLANAITQNYMATGNQYVQQAMNNLWNPIALGQTSAAGQAIGAQNAGNQGANLLTGAGNAGAAGMVGAANAQQAGMGNLAQIGAGLLGAFMCDARRKRDLIPMFKDRDGLQVYAFRYTDSDDWYNGKMAQDIAKVDPNHVFDRDGVLYVSGKYAPVRVH